MEKSFKKFQFISIFYKLTTTFIILFVADVGRAHQLGNDTDHTALLAIKSQLLDRSETGVFRSWNHSLHHCSWDGVTCGPKHNRVTVLNLSSRGLVGTISPFTGNLSFLTDIELYNNSLTGNLPPELGRLFKLQSLRVFYNMISGEIPANLSACVNLEKLSIGYNKLEGKIPLELRALSKLKFLAVHFNNFSGALFEITQNITSLETISASDNSFTGLIDTNIGKFQNLSTLIIAGNEISGTIPISVLNCSLLETLDLADTKLHGEIPPDIGLRLPGLVELQLAPNRFSGSFPKSLLNLTSIENIDLGTNNFTGVLPNDFSQLYQLKYLYLLENYFEGDINFIGSLVNSTNLQILALSANKFTGILPASLANLSTNVRIIGVDDNRISGHIPKHLSNLINLRLLLLNGNQLIGSIPHDLGMLQNLDHIEFQSNRLTNSIPESLSNISRLSTLYLYNNELEGSIPPSLGDCPNLLDLGLSHNRLNGTLQLLRGSNKFVEVHLSGNLLEGSIPPEISNQINLVALSVSQNKLTGIIPDGLGQCLPLRTLDIHGKFVGVDLSNNNIEGSIPVEIGNQINLVQLFLFQNKLSGIIPDGLGHCSSLQELYIHDNFFYGVIPTSFKALTSLISINLSRNNFSGTIPNYFTSFSQLEALNLSYNNFEGEVPTTGVFANISAISLDGNVNLCGGIPKLHLPRCKIPSEPKKRRNARRVVKLTVSMICALVGVFIVMAWLYLACYKKKRVPSSSESAKDALMKVSYDMLLKATNGFSPENLLGVGNFGSVFRGNLNGVTIAVKVLNLETRGASKSFMAECKVLRNVRHRNLVGIITACSSIDHQRNDFKALVYEFMPNGNLDGWLHGNRVENLTLLKRVDIAIDVAHALSYLHHDCEIPIVHCDLKPTSVLLDEDMVARAGDFGLAKFLTDTQNYQSSSIGVRGTVGYAAPEYGLGSEPYTDGDIYSYGILVLELMTGKRPTDNIFQEDYNLHSYTEAAFPDNILDIVNPTLLEDDHEINEKEKDNKRATQATNQRRFECMVDVIGVGVGCSKHLPQDRMRIGEAISKLQAAKDNLCNVRRNRNNI